jgi:hypothetical protein
MIDLISVIIVAALGVIGNIVYFEYRFKKEYHKEIVKEQLIKLLLPLYMVFKTDELEFFAWQKNDDADLYEYESDKPDRLFKPIKEILDKNLFLADEELQMYAMLFVEWAYREDSRERFQRVHYKVLEQDKILNDFRELVYKKYNEQKEKYLG